MKRFLEHFPVYSALTYRFIFGFSKIVAFLLFVAPGIVLPSVDSTKVVLPVLEVSRAPIPNFRKDHEKVLKEIMDFIRQNPKAMIQVEGYVNESRNREDDFSVGTELAEQAIKRLVSMGADAEKLNPISFRSEISRVGAPKVRLVFRPFLFDEPARVCGVVP